jgi:hypothetical protein
VQVLVFGEQRTMCRENAGGAVNHLHGQARCVLQGIDHHREPSSQGGEMLMGVVNRNQQK